MAAVFPSPLRHGATQECKKLALAGVGIRDLALQQRIRHTEEVQHLRQHIREIAVEKMQLAGDLGPCIPAVVLCLDTEEVAQQLEQGQQWHRLTMRGAMRLVDRYARRASPVE